MQSINKIVHFIFRKCIILILGQSMCTILIAELNCALKVTDDII